MSIRFAEKRFYHRATRHAGEAYAPALADDGRTLAYLQVDGDHERVMWQRGPGGPAHALSAPGQAFAPVFAGPWLVWVERQANDWLIRTANWTHPSPVPRTLRMPGPGRPIHLVAAAHREQTWLAWEERTGRQTTITVAALSGDGVLQPGVMITPPDTNGYDPALAVGHDGCVYCACSAYAHGNYRIYLARLTPDGRPDGEPRLAGNHHDACVWPSLWPATGGGVWFSYASFSAASDGSAEAAQAVSYVRHARYRQQRQFFHGRGVVHAGRFDGQRCMVAVAAPSSNAMPYYLNTGVVFGSEGAGHSQVLEDAGGGVHVIFRQHADPGRLLACEEADAGLKRHERFKPMRADRMHPNLSVTSLVGGVWQPADVIVPRAHFDLALAPRFDGRQLALPFAEDARRTGWSGEGEWFDDTGEVGLGVARLHFSADKTPVVFSPLAVPPHPAGTMTNPTEMPPGAAQWQDRICALGQTHCHSNLSVCNRETDRDPHFNYRFMQDVQHCRFGALTDHEYNLWHTEMLIGRKLADYYYFPGEFVALPAYEWTGSDRFDCSHDGGPFGHFNVLGFEPLAGSDYHNPNDPASPGNTPARFWALMAGRSVITPPHHVVDFNHYYHWEFWHGTFQPVVEIFQDDRGSGEQPDAPGLTNGTHADHPVWVVDALRAGRRFGFIAAGDHNGIALAGVWTLALDRETLHAAFRERITYATTGIHAAVMLTANHRPMGCDGVGSPVEFTLRVGSAEPVARVEILHNGNVVRTWAGAGDQACWIWEEPSAQAADFWYARIHWPDGELAWTSPIWV